MQIVTKHRVVDSDPTVTVNLDLYEAEILFQALRQHVALAKVELDNMIEDLQFRHQNSEDDWRNNPDLHGLEEMFSRAEQFLKDARKLREVLS